MLQFILAALILLSRTAADSLPQTSEDVRAVGDAPLLQRAVSDGVRHIILTDHIDAVNAQADPEGLETSKDNAIADVKPSTRSIVGNCTGSPPEEWKELMLEPLPPGACAVLVTEDFLEMHIGVPELWVHNLYVFVEVVANPIGSSTLILHKDGDLYLTQSVFQGRQRGSRAIDLNTNDDGRPLLYAEGTTFSDFERDHGAAMRLQSNAYATLVGTSFKRNTVTANPQPKPSLAGITGSAVAATNHSYVWILEGIVLEDQIVFNQEAGAKALSWTSGPLKGGIWAQPTVLTYDYGTMEEVGSLKAGEIGSVSSRFLRRGSFFDGIKQEQARFAAQIFGSADLGRRAAIAGADAKVESSNSRQWVYWVAAAAAVAVALAAAAMVLLFLRRKRTGSFRAQGASRKRSEQHKPADQKEIDFEDDVILEAVSPRWAHHPRAYGATLPSSNRSTSSLPGVSFIPPPGSGSDTTVSHPEPLQPSPIRPSPHLAPSNTTSSSVPLDPVHFHSNEHINSNSSSLQPFPKAASGTTSFPSEYEINHPSHIHTVANTNKNTTSCSDPPSSSLGSFPEGSISRTKTSTSEPTTTIPSVHHTRMLGFGLRDTNHVTTLDVTSMITLPRPSSPGDMLDRDLLELALDQLHNNGLLFLGQFKMLGPINRRAGGQGTVQFARRTQSDSAVAIKFFLNRTAFNVEEALYMKDGLRDMMPAITMIENNEAGVAVTEEGWKFPPFIVVERGESLDEWQARIQPDFPTIVQVLSHVTERVKTLHTLDMIHRDLKPGNVLWRPGQHSWTLIDFGCAAEIGKIARLTYSLSYSPPETLQLVTASKCTVVADAAADIWAVGVIAYELITGGSAFPRFEWTRDDIQDAALGKRAYPWEEAVGSFRNIPQLRALTEPVCACLARVPADRPSSDELLAKLNGLFDHV